MLRVMVLGFLVFGLVGCGSSGSNPFGSFGSINPFGRGSEDRVETDATGAQSIVSDVSVLAPSIRAVTPETALRGLIIRVEATAPSQGYHSPYLFPKNRGLPDKDGIVTYEFRVTPPEITQGLGAARTRNLIAATFIGDGDLRYISGFRIVGQNNVVNIRP